MKRRIYLHNVPRGQRRMVRLAWAMLLAYPSQTVTRDDFRDVIWEVLANELVSTRPGAGPEDL